MFADVCPNPGRICPKTPVIPETMDHITTYAVGSSARSPHYSSFIYKLGASEIKNEIL